MTPRTIRAAFDVQVCVALAAGKGDLARALRVACAAVAYVRTADLLERRAAMRLRVVS